MSRERQKEKISILFIFINNNYRSLHLAAWEGRKQIKRLIKCEASQLCAVNFLFKSVSGRMIQPTNAVHFP